MFLVCQILGLYMNVDNIISIMIKTATGILTYLVMLILLKDNYIKSLKNTVKNLIARGE